MMIIKSRGRGYTLIEVLVAMTILALTLSIIFRIFSGGLLKIGIATDYTSAVMVAESVLAATGNTQRLVTGETSGRVSGKYRWSRSINPYQFSEVLWQNNKSVNPYTVSVVVEWPVRDGFRSLNLTTLKLAGNSPTEARK